MLQKIVVVMMIGLVSNLANFANDSEKEMEFAQKVKSEITRLGTGPDARVSVKLKDGTKVKGYVTEIKSDSFLMKNEKPGMTMEVPYSQVKQVKGNNLSTGATIAIAVGVIVGLIVVESFEKRGFISL
ncbi:MAG: hypothetical protein ACRD6X_20630 [Pyrinomonadaceae bacterium]